jgi:hypothetical protein
MGDYAARQQAPERRSRFFGICPKALWSEAIIVMKLDDHKYTAILMFDDATFCKHIYNLLQQNIGRRIEEIGD